MVSAGLQGSSLPSADLPACQPAAGLAPCLPCLLLCPRTAERRGREKPALPTRQPNTGPQVRRAGCTFSVPTSSWSLSAGGPTSQTHWDPWGGGGRWLSQHFTHVCFRETGYVIRTLVISHNRETGAAPDQPQRRLPVLLREEPAAPHQQEDPVATPTTHKPPGPETRASEEALSRAQRCLTGGGPCPQSYPPPPLGRNAHRAVGGLRLLPSAQPSSSVTPC